MAKTSQQPDKHNATQLKRFDKLDREMMAISKPNEKKNNGSAFITLLKTYCQIK